MFDGIEFRGFEQRYADVLAEYSGVPVWNGLTDATAGQADCLIRIPMKGQLESLNAGVAAAILMYEAYRQRRKEYK